MSANFHHLQRLPLELQLMVFEEFIQAAQKPRIVLLDAEDCQVFQDDFFGHLVPELGWQLSVENREQLRSESPAVVARRLLAVCSSSRQVAKRFLDRLAPVAQAPEDHEALMGLGLSLSDDLFWLPDDLPRYEEVRDRTAAVGDSLDECRMRSIMISIEAFAFILHWAQPEQLWDRQEVFSRDSVRFYGMLQNLLVSYCGARSLVIMVDVPRRHICWDQIQIVKGNDRAEFEMSDEQSARCDSAFDKYEALRIDDEQNFAPYNPYSTPWPEVYFAFRRQSMPDTP